MTTSFKDKIERLWGFGAQTKCARHFGVDARSVRRWLDGSRAVPAAVEKAVDAMLAISPPPSSTADEDRNYSCQVAIGKSLTDLYNRAVGAGWHPAEVATAILTLTVSEMRAGAGDAAARQTLEAAIQMLDE